MSEASRCVEFARIEVDVWGRNTGESEVLFEGR